MTTNDRRTAAAHVFVSADVLAAGGVLVVDDALDHHLQRVLRLRAGEIVSVADGAGSWCLSRVVAGPTVGLEVVGEVVSDPPPVSPFAIATAIPKRDRLDWLVQKTTELGVDRLQLLDAERSVVRWNADRRDKQLARLRRIAEEAARQSRRTRLVQIDAPVPAVNVLPLCVVAEPGGRPVAAGDRFVAIGPEGGWSPAELNLAREQVDLGPNVLRTETAAIAATALCVACHH